MASINAEQAVEKALEVMGKGGWSYVVASEAFQEDGYWIVVVETIVREMRVGMDAGGVFLGSERSSRPEPYINLAIRYLAEARERLGGVGVKRPRKACGEAWWRR